MTISRVLTIGTSHRRSGTQKVGVVLKLTFDLRCRPVDRPWMHYAALTSALRALDQHRRSTKKHEDIPYLLTALGSVLWLAFIAPKSRLFCNSFLCEPPLTVNEKLSVPCSTLINDITGHGEQR